ncbi:head-tail adaptor protein [Methylobacterium sp. A54F]
MRQFLSPTPLARLALGARRRRFVLERPVDEPDGFGGRLRRYVAGPLVWGAIEPLGQAERSRGGRSDSVATHRITLRARPGLAPEMRLAAGPRRFTIRSVGDPAERGRDLVCEVEELAEAAS